MSTTTTNYSLFKPDLGDPADITALNQNWDAIDDALLRKSFDVVVPTGGWAARNTMYSVTVTVQGMTEDFNPIYGLSPVGDYVTETEEEMFALIKGVVTGANTVILYASERPTSSITLTLWEV